MASTHNPVTTADYGLLALIKFTKPAVHMISCKLYLLFSVNYPEMNVPFQGTIHIANIPAVLEYD